MATKIETSVAKIETVVNDMHARLFGNGQPGIIQEHGESLNALYNFKNRVIGALIIIAVMVSALGITKIISLFS